MDRVDDHISRQAAIDEWKNDFKGYINALDIPKDDYKGIMEYIDELPPAQPDVPGINVIIDTIKNAINASTGNEAYMIGLRNGMRWCLSALTDKEPEYEDMPSAQPNYDEWCTDCKEYDKERHSCPRWNRVIRQTVEDMKAAQPGWVPCTPETMPKNKSNVLTVIYIPGRQAHIRSGWYDDGLFMNDNGDTWNATDEELVGWMYQPKLPKPYREGGQDE